MRPNWKQIAAGFLIGCLIGGVVGARCQKAAFHRFWKHGPDPQRMLKKFTHELDLDAKQQEVVKQIIEKHHNELRDLHNKVSGQFSAIRMSMRSEIQKVLTPEQHKKFEIMMARWDARHPELRPEPKTSPLKQP